MDVNGQNLDPTSTGAITATVDKQAGLTNQGLANEYMSSAPQAKGLLKDDNFNSGLSYGDSAMSKAIKQRYQPDFDRSQRQLKLDAVQGAQSDHIRNLNVATQAAGQEVEMNKQRALLKWKIEQANKQARGAVLGQVLGITGAVVGAVAGAFTGGAASVPLAAAGYAAGSGLGNAVGSAN